MAACNQEEFLKFGTKGKCIEARELVIALPESFVDLDMPRAELLKIFTDAFSDKYGVACASALHHNKSKTNYHIHLIFSERELLEKPVTKTATRNMFYDENGKHVRTKKEIMDGDGNIRKGCRIIPKGSIYERQIFAGKKEVFKTRRFLKQVKEEMTDLINSFVVNENEKLKVFDQNGIYLATKKIGKNNPKEAEIKERNRTCEEWNAMADSALLVGISEQKILDHKNENITRKVHESIRENGAAPEHYIRIVKVATAGLAKLIDMIRRGVEKFSDKIPFPKKEQNEINDTAKTVLADSMTIKAVEVTPEAIAGAPPRPVRSRRTDMCDAYEKIREKLEKAGVEYTLKYRELEEAREDLAHIGFLQRKQKETMQKKVDSLAKECTRISKGRKKIAEEAGFSSIQEFEQEYQAARSERSAYASAVREWESKYLVDPDKAETMGGALAAKKRMKNRKKAEQNISGQVRRNDRKKGQEL